MINLKNFQLDSLKNYSINELDELAKEIRKEIIKQVSINGGHLASNLGVVELTIALHYVFNSPIDKLIFDVSHQTYVHKLLTGRSLENLRSKDGISGFSKMNESIHDVFEGGHSSTSIAAGFGFATAKQMGQEIGEIISIIGDASLTNGLAFEALNLLGAHPDKKMIIIVNDNNMSVSQNVGAMAKAFNKVRTGKGYRFIKKITPRFIYKLAHKINGAAKSYVYNNKFFNSLGYSYIEGIDGHNFKQLIKYLNYAKESKNSVVLHVKTIKGKGYSFAENDKLGVWHNTSPFDIETGVQTKLENNVTGYIIGNYLVDRVNKDWKNLMVISPAMALGSGLNEFAAKCPNNFLDVGIAEESAVVIASALSISKCIPFVFIYSSFLQRSYDQILHDVARTNQHVVFCIDRAGIVGGDGDTHQGIYDVAFLKTIPNVIILEPKNKEDLLTMLDYTYSNPGVYAIRYHKTINDFEIKSIRENIWETILPITNKLVITSGNNVKACYDYLKDKNIGLINADNLSFIDEKLIKSLEKNTEIYVLEEIIKNNSLGEELSRFCYDNNLSLKINKFSLPNDYLIAGREDELKEYYNLLIEKIIR